MLFSKLKQNPQFRGVVIVAAILLLIMTVMAISIPSFRSAENIGNVLVQFLPLAIVSMGQTIAIISGGIDLSVGVTISATTAVLATAMPEFGVVPAILMVIVLGVCVGLFNGFGIAVLKVPPLITTISSMTILQGITFAFLSSPGGQINKEFAQVLSLRFGLVSVPLGIMLLQFLLLRHLLYRTRFGLHVYAIGGDAKIADSAGVKVAKTTIWSYITTSLCAVLAGIVLACRLRTGDPIIGVPFGLDSITAAVIGGTSLAGGSGLLSGSIIGALLVGMLSNIMNSIGVSSFYQYVFKGLLLIVTMIVYSLANRSGGENE